MEAKEKKEEQKREEVNKIDEKRKEKKQNIIINKQTTSKGTNAQKPKKKNANKQKGIHAREKIKTHTIEETMSEAVKNAVKKIKIKYYVKMQTGSGKLELPKEYKEREKYTKRYDVLETVLESEEKNKRAQMELMLILINEGYRSTVKKSFPEEDCNFINGMIQQFKEQKMNAQEVQKHIDEYCL